MVPGAPPETILGTALDDEDDEVSLAASADALAFGMHPDPSDDFSASRVMIGPARGPLREVATCPAGLIVSPVAVAGTRIAWRDGACGEPVTKPSAVGAAAVVVAGADPAAPVRRAEIPGEELALGLVLGGGDSGLVGTVRPSFFGFDTETRAFSPAGLGESVTLDRAHLVTPVGILGDGARLFLQSGVDDDESCAAKQLFTLAPATGARSSVTLGGCLDAAPILGPRDGKGPLATGNRIVGFAATPESQRRSPTESIVSMRADGSDHRVLVEGGYRRPAGVAVDGERVAWWQPHCAGGQEIVVQSAPEPVTRLAACRAEVLTRRARVHGGRINMRIRCPAGCSGSIFSPRGRQRAFSFEAGTRALSVPVVLGKRKRARVPFFLTVDHGPSPTAVISVRR